jgi:hypothetical protein
LPAAATICRKWGFVAKKPGYFSKAARAKRKREREKRADAAIFPYDSTRLNPRKLRKVTKTTGWIKATAVKFVKIRGKPVQVLVQRPGGVRGKRKGKK